MGLKGWIASSVHRGPMKLATTPHCASKMQSLTVVCALVSRSLPNLGLNGCHFEQERRQSRPWQFICTEKTGRTGFLTQSCFVRILLGIWEEYYLGGGIL